MLKSVRPTSPQDLDRNNLVIASLFCLTENIINGDERVYNYKSYLKTLKRDKEGCSGGFKKKKKKSGLIKMG